MLRNLTYLEISLDFDKSVDFEDGLENAWLTFHQNIWSCYQLLKSCTLFNISTMNIRESNKTIKSNESWYVWLEAIFAVKRNSKIHLSSYLTLNNTIRTLLKSSNCYLMSARIWGYSYLEGERVRIENHPLKRPRLFRRSRVFVSSFRPHWLDRLHFASVAFLASGDEKEYVKDEKREREGGNVVVKRSFNVLEKKWTKKRERQGLRYIKSPPALAVRYVTDTG